MRISQQNCEHLTTERQRSLRSQCPGGLVGSGEPQTHGAEASHYIQVEPSPSRDRVWVRVIIRAKTRSERKDADQAFVIPLTLTLSRQGREELVS